MRIGDLEFRRNDGMTRGAEIVVWHPYEGKDLTSIKEFCYTLLWWKDHGEGPYIEFVGDRPLMYHNKDALFAMMVYGQTILDAEDQLKRSV